MKHSANHSETASLRDTRCGSPLRTQHIYLITPLTRLGGQNDVRSQESRTGSEMSSPELLPEELRHLLPVPYGRLRHVVYRGYKRLTEGEESQTLRSHVGPRSAVAKRMPRAKPFRHE